MCVHVEKQSPEVFYKKRFSENFAKFTVKKHASGLRAAALLKSECNTGVFL